MTVVVGLYVGSILLLVGFWLGIGRVARTLARMERTVDRMEAAAAIVAINLADSVSRADATEGPEGAAADAALRTGDTAAAIHARQDQGHQ